MPAVNSRSIRSGPGHRLFNGGSLAHGRVPRGRDQHRARGLITVAPRAAPDEAARISSDDDGLSGANRSVRSSIARASTPEITDWAVVRRYREEPPVRVEGVARSTCTYAAVMTEPDLSSLTVLGSDVRELSNTSTHSPLRIR
jgi:hypothetical protein